MDQKYSILFIFLACCILFYSCGNSQCTDVDNKFVGEISGTINGKVTRPGVIRYIPPYNDTSEPGYFFIADSTGVRKLGITISIPDKIQPGKYKLVSTNPLDAGKEFEVRVDHSIGKKTHSYEQNTKGSITILSFPENPNDIPRSRVTGCFEFRSQNKNGNQISVQGSFDFRGM